MANPPNIEMDFLKKMSLIRQKNLMQLKSIQLAKKTLLNQEGECRKRILLIERKMRSTVMENEELKKKFDIGQESSED